MEVENGDWEEAKDGDVETAVSGSTALMPHALGQRELHVAQDQAAHFEQSSLVPPSHLPSIRTHTHTYMHIHTHAFTHIHTYTHINTYTHTRARAKHFINVFSTGHTHSVAPGSLDDRQLDTE